MPSKKSTKTKNKETDDDAEIKKLQRRLPKSDEHYVSPKEFSEQILNYYETGKMSDELVTMASNIATRLAFRPNFINYTYREDMIGDAVVKMMSALIHKKFNHKKAKGNPFSYFTKIASNAFKNRIKKEKKQHEAFLNYQQQVYDNIMGEALHQNQPKNTRHCDQHEFYHDE